MLRFAGRAALLIASALITTTAVAQRSTEQLQPAQATELIRGGGVALIMRHGETEPGIGDPPGFTLDDCKTQRNLSDAGRAALRGMGARLAAAKVRFAHVFSSRWCRCRESARLLTAAQGGGVEAWPALDSQFAGNPLIPAANAQVIEKVRHMPRTESWLLLTHQVNIAALTGISPAQGEGVLVRPAPDGIAVVGRVKL